MEFHLSVTNATYFLTKLHGKEVECFTKSAINAQVPFWYRSTGTVTAVQHCHWLVTAAWQQQWPTTLRDNTATVTAPWQPNQLITLRGSDFGRFFLARLRADFFGLCFTELFIGSKFLEILAVFFLNFLDFLPSSWDHELSLWIEIWFLKGSYSSWSFSKN